MGRLLQSILKLQIMGLAGMCGAVGLAIGYHGVLELLSGQLAAAMVALLIGPAVGIAAYLLCRYRNDLTWC